MEPECKQKKKYDFVLASKYQGDFFFSTNWCFPGLAVIEGVKSNPPYREMLR